MSTEQKYYKLDVEKYLHQRENEKLFNKKENK
jgi:hypothetical protein